MFWRPQCVWVIALPLFASCTMAGRSGPSAPSQLRSAEVFAAAVEEIRDVLGGILFIDPRPIPLDDYADPRDGTYYDGAEAVARERAMVLVAMGVESASGLPLIPDCQGLMSAPPGHRVVHGCPAERTVVALFDTIRSGPAADQWTLWVLPIIYEPGAGRHATFNELVIALRGGRYTVVERRRGNVFERH
jgi:hypothetical protein